MIISYRALLKLSEEAMLSTCHIQNKIPYKEIGKTPYEL